MKISTSAKSIYNFSPCERLMRLAVFQIGSCKGLFERVMLCIYNFFTKIKCTAKMVDHERAERSLRSYQSFGTQLSFVTPRDGKAKIQMLHLRALDFEKKINALGGRWERIVIPGQQSSKSIFAIIPPPLLSDDWKTFEESLSMFKWRRRVEEVGGQSKEVIVTCENADMIEQEDCFKNLFLHCKSAGVSFIMMGRRAGFYLGCKQDLCFFDTRGTWKSTGIASEAGYYNDALAVFEKVKGFYENNNIWVTSTCGGAAMGGYLKSIYHQTEVNFLFENSFSNMKRDFVSHESYLVRKLADRYWGSLASKDIDKKNKPRETGFNIQKAWENLEQTDLGKIVLVTVKNDQFFPPDVTQRNIQLAKRISKNVSHFTFTSLQKNAHSDYYFNHPVLATSVLSSVFKK